jgi:flagellar biosynthesis/type III secretory pathway protein FliH
MAPPIGPHKITPRERLTVNEQARRFLRVRLFSIGLVALSAVACATHKPLANATITQAERAVDEAQEAGAAISAPAEFKIAQDKLKAAQAAMAKGNYERAIRSAEQAAIDADYARARAANQRVNTTVNEMGQYIKALRQEIERLPQ